MCKQLNTTQRRWQDFSADMQPKQLRKGVICEAIVNPTTIGLTLAQMWHKMQVY
jgi:hypothetical protein